MQHRLIKVRIFHCAVLPFFEVCESVSAYTLLAKARIVDCFPVTLLECIVGIKCLLLEPIGSY